MEQGVRSFEDLKSWQEARLLAKHVYVSTKDFPKTEQFALTNQMRRAATSVGANIAEGFSRQSIADKAHFYSMALGSLTELQSFFYTAFDIEYLKEQQRVELYNQSVRAHKLLNGLIKSTKRRQK